MIGLVGFLTARLDEDEQAALHAGEGRIAWLTYHDGDGQMLYTTVAAGSPEAENANDIWIAAGKELSRPARVRVVYDQARVLADVAAKRRMLDELYPEIKDADEAILGEWNSSPENADILLEMLALPYADHPGYRQEWAP